MDNDKKFTQEDLEMAFRAGEARERSMANIVMWETFKALRQSNKPSYELDFDEWSQKLEAYKKLTDVKPNGATYL